MRFEGRRRGHVVAGLIIVSGAFAPACGGTEAPPPTETRETRVSLAFTGGTCAARLPSPSDLLLDDRLEPRTAPCTAPTTVDLAIADLARGGGAALDTNLRFPIEGIGVSAASLTSSVSLGFGATSSTITGVPPAVLLEQTGTATSPRGWREVRATLRLVDGALELVPQAPLAPARRHVAILTSALRDTAGARVRTSAGMKLLLGAAPITAGALEGLDADAAQGLEAERARLAPLLALLAAHRPALPADAIVGVSGFTTRLGLVRLDREVAKLDALVRASGAPTVTTMGGDLAPDSVDPRWVELKRQYNGGCPVGFQASGCYDRVRAFRRGVVRVPRFTDDTGALRADWDRTAATSFVDVPFLASIPADRDATPVTEAPVTVLLVGHGRGRVDARELANEYAARMSGVVLALELAGLGDRSANAADAAPNNANPELSGPDGIPDASGEGYFPGAPRALRDQPVAAALEVLAVLAAHRAKSGFVSQGIPVDGRNVTLVAHGYTAPVGLLVAAETNVRVLVLPAGGVGTRELVGGLPANVRAAIAAKTGLGVDAAGLDAYLTKLDPLVDGVLLDDALARVRTRLITSSGQSPRVLVPTGERPGVVPDAARMRLVTGLRLGNDRVSRHRGLCDDFFLFTCRAGDNFAWVAGARAQFASFSSSNGVTVLAPAP